MAAKAAFIFARSAYYLIKNTQVDPSFKAPKVLIINGVNSSVNPSELNENCISVINFPSHQGLEENLSLRHPHCLAMEIEQFKKRSQEVLRYKNSSYFFYNQKPVILIVVNNIEETENLLHNLEGFKKDFFIVIWAKKHFEALSLLEANFLPYFYEYIDDNSTGNLSLTLDHYHRETAESFPDDSKRLQVVTPQNLSSYIRNILTSMPLNFLLSKKNFEVSYSTFFNDILILNSKNSTAKLNHKVAKTVFSGRKLKKDCFYIKDKQKKIEEIKSVVFSVSNYGESATEGDFFTALELGKALKNSINCSVKFSGKKTNDWYESKGADLVISMIHDYKIKKIKNFRKIYKVAWIRNKPHLWVKNINHLRAYDLILVSSSEIQRYICSRCNFRAHLLPLASSFLGKCPNNKGERHLDLVFTGHNWGFPREIVSHAIATEDIEKYKFHIYGAGWNDVTKKKANVLGPQSYEVMPQIYQKSKVVLDDACAYDIHALQWGALNSRIFDALALGAHVITNNLKGFDELFPNVPNGYKSIQELGLKIEHLTSLRDNRDNKSSNLGLARNHTYTHRAKRLVQFSERKHDITLTISPPSWSIAPYWGDYHFAKSLQGEFQAMGYTCELELFNQTKGSHSTLNLEILGLNRQLKKNINSKYSAIWLISHPDKFNTLDLNEVDHVFVASSKFFPKNIGTTSYSTLLQCTDLTNLEPKVAKRYLYDILFIGNSRNIFRKSIKNLEELSLDYHYIGKEWEQFNLTGKHLGIRANKYETASSYNSAQINLNDHWKDMAENGFISNRVFDIAGANGLCLSDYVEGLEDLFEGNVPFYKSTEDFAQKINEITSDYSPYKKKIKAAHRIVSERHTFRKRAETIINHFDL